MTDVRDVIETVKTLAASDAYVQYGTVFDDSMEDRLRVTVIATGWAEPVGSPPDKAAQVFDIADFLHKRPK